MDEQLFEFGTFNVWVWDATEDRSRHHFWVRVETQDEEFGTYVDGPPVKAAMIQLDPNEPAPDLSQFQPPPPLSAFVEAAYKVLTDFKKLAALGPANFLRQVVMLEDHIYNRKLLDQKAQDAEDLMPFIASIGERELDGAIVELKRGLEIFPKR